MATTFVKMHGCGNDFVILDELRQQGLTDYLVMPMAFSNGDVHVSTWCSAAPEGFSDRAVEILGTERLVMMHATSTYPLPPEEANLRMITTLRQRYGVPVGYSGHERGLQISLAAVTLGAVTVERHITLDRTMWGSDHAASLEPNGIGRLVSYIRLVEQSLGDGVKSVSEREKPIIQKLRRVGAKV